MTAHNTAADMARQLVGYIDSDQRIKSAIAAEFRVPISIGAIARIRRTRTRQAETFRQQNTVWVDDSPDPYFCTEFARRVSDMERRNTRFVAALEIARHG